jgi:hypothetical protein
MTSEGRQSDGSAPATLSLDPPIDLPIDQCRGQLSLLVVRLGSGVVVPPVCPAVAGSSGWAVLGAGSGGGVAGGLQVWVNSLVQECCQGQASGRCRVTRRLEDATRDGTPIRVRRMVAVVARASVVPVRLRAPAKAAERPIPPATPGSD